MHKRIYTVNRHSKINQIYFTYVTKLYADFRDPNRKLLPTSKDVNITIKKKNEDTVFHYHNRTRKLSYVLPDKLQAFYETSSECSIVQQQKNLGPLIPAS